MNAANRFDPALEAPARVPGTGGWVLPDYSGRSFGELAVEGWEPRREGWRCGRWRCRCSCGRAVFVSGSALRFGQTRTCAGAGCKRGGGGAADLRGRRFGFLVAVRRVGTDPGTGSALWECRCERPVPGGGVCGAPKTVRGAALAHGQMRSCGCLRRAAGADRTPREPAAAMAGRVYGKLRCEVLLAPEAVGKGQARFRWRCRCLGGGPNCAGWHDARANDLRSGNTKSCGCLAGRRGKGVAGKGVAAGDGACPSSSAPVAVGRAVGRAVPVAGQG